MQVTVLLISLLLGTYSVLYTSGAPHRFRKITVTHYSATSNTILLRWRKKIGDARLTNFKVAYLGRRNYHDSSNAIHDIISHGQSAPVKSDRILLTNLTHCTKYSITISGWNDLTTITNKPIRVKTLPKVVEPIVPTITTQLKSDGRTHAVVTVYPNADNLGCKKYQLIVMISDNITESQQWGVNSLDEALTNQVTYVYITAEFNDTTPLNTIELGDGKFYSSYLNKPLLPSVCYRVAIRIVFSKESEIHPTYSELSADRWCLKPLVPALDTIRGVKKSTAGKAIGISIGVIVFLLLLVFGGWAILLICQKKPGLFYTDKIIKGPSLWDVVRGKKGPHVLDQLISVDYHEESMYDRFDDEDMDLLSSEISIVRDVRFPSEQLTEHIDDYPATNKVPSEGSNVSSEGPQTSIEHLYDEPATDSS